MEITFKGRHTSVPERFRRHATAKLAKLEKLDHNAIRIDVEVSTERNPRQADRSERVELTIRSRGPAIRAEAAADDRYAALDLAFAKIEGRLRKAAERRKVSRGGLTVRSTDALAAVAAGPADARALAAEAGALADVAIPAIPQPDDAAMLAGTPVGRKANGKGSGKPSVRAAAKVGNRPGGQRRPEAVVPLPAFSQEEDPGREFDDFRDEAEAEATVSGVLPMHMVGDGPLIVR
jgi:ribosomal subunit interface protein